MLVGDRELISALTGALTLFASLYQMARERTVEEYRSTSDRPTSTVESPEDYRRPADQCRETARTVSAGNGRTNLLAMAEIWGLLADRVGRTPST
jgi:hypothetical protein